MRVKIIQIIAGITFLFLSLGLFYTQLIRGTKYRQLSQANCIRIIPQKGTRGRILDRRGNVIVDNYLSYNIAMLPNEVAATDKTLGKLAELFKFSFKDIKSKFETEIASASMPSTLVSNIDRREAIMIEELKSDMPGVFIQVVPQRSYPYGSLAAHLLGYLGEIDHWRLTKLKDYGYKTKDIVGYTGIEEKYDYYLRSEEGGLQVEVDNRNRLVRILGFKPAVGGKDIQLTIDLTIQKIAEESLEDRIGTVVILDPHSGEILAMANSPTFQPALFLNKSPQLSKLLNDPRAPVLNRCITGLYPAGSIFKVIVAAAGLQTNKIGLNDKFFCNGSIRLGREEFSCWDKHGNENLIEAITHSCNVFFYRLGLLLGGDRLYEYATKFGLGKPTQIDLPAEAAGFVPSPLRKRLNKFQGWYDGDTVNLAIGQGALLVTPIQIARMMAAFANSGDLIRPYLIKAIDGKDISRLQKKVSAVSLDKRTLDNIKLGMKKVVDDTDGTARVLRLDTVTVAGKTGTAQLARGQSHAWFSGYFPTEDPKFTICVVLEHAGPSFNACLVAKKIIEKMQAEGLL